jgi:SAM-dependent methyltransferase
MKPFELIYLAAEPFLPPLHRKVRQRLSAVATAHPCKLDLLDVGGRKSHYTIGVPAEVTITDLPRESAIQQKLNLGLTNQIIDKSQARRSNVRRMLYDDMTRSTLPNESFDCVVAVEVLEHVEEDENFVREVKRVLRPGGLFLMTTPNGDSVKNTNPDHKRHYRREQLTALLSRYFKEVDVEYAIRGGRFRSFGLRSWTPRRPLQTGLSMVGNVVNSLQSASDRLKNRSQGTRHLIATARKQK